MYINSQPSEEEIFLRKVIRNQIIKEKQMHFICFITFSEWNKNFYLEFEVPWILLLCLLLLVRIRE